jgi:hypothetical protein
VENFRPQISDFEQSHRYFVVDLAAGGNRRSL